jgi:hypothetical protein
MTVTVSSKPNLQFAPVRRIFRHGWQLQFMVDRNYPNGHRAFTSEWSFPSLEVSQQSLKGFLVAVVVFPAREITNVPRPAKIGGPRLGGIHHCIIRPNRKEHEFAGPVLTLASGLNFTLNPGAVERVFRDYDQQFVV